MSISSRGDANRIGAGPNAPVPSWRSGAFRWGVLALVAAVAGLASSNQAKAQSANAVKALIGSAVSNPTEEDYPEIKSAIGYFTNRDATAAMGQLTLAKEKHPKLPPADMMMASLWIAAKQAQQAQGALEKCIKDNPNDPEAYLVLADMSFSERRIEEAELLFAKAEQLSATFTENLKRAADFKARAEAGLAAVAESREQWDIAAKYLQNWLKDVDPNGPAANQGEPNSAGANAHIRLGQVLFHADQSENKKDGARQAYEQFKLARQDDPQSVSPDIALAGLYEDAKMHDMAKTFISRAVLNLPQETAAKVGTLLAAARWALDTNQADDAFKYAEQAYTVDPHSKRAMEAKYYMGVAARMRGDTKTAEQNLEEVCAAQPGNFNASNQLAQVLSEENTPEQQERGYEIAANNYAASQGEAARREPARAIEAAATLGWALFELDRIPEADQVTQAIINTGVSSPDIWYYRAKLFQYHGQTKEAVESLNNALKNTRGFFIHRDDAKRMLAQLDKTHNGSGSSDNSSSSSTSTPATPPSTAPATPTPSTPSSTPATPPGK